MAKKLGLKLTNLFGLIVFTVQLNFITRSVVFWLHNLVIGSLLKLLSIVEILSIYSHMFFELNY